MYETTSRKMIYVFFFVCVSEDKAFSCACFSYFAITTVSTNVYVFIFTNNKNSKTIIIEVL